MYSRLKEQFSTTAIILSIVALVFATMGGAYAASQQSEGKATASKGKRGKPGKPGKPGKEGPQGPVGPVGPQGPAGLPGAKGDSGQQGIQGIQGIQGSKGDKGDDGDDGNSAEVTPLSPSDPECGNRGGALVGVEDSLDPAAEVCNGEKGTFGPSIKLEPGQVMTGVWAFSDLDLAEGDIRIPVSLVVHLNAPVFNEESQHVWFGVPGGGDTTFNEHCGGSLSAPTVLKPGELCVYRGSIGFDNATFDNAYNPGVNPPFGTKGLLATGGYLRFVPTADDASGSGVWAVRGCTIAAGPEHCPDE